MVATAAALLDLAIVCSIVSATYFAWRFPGSVPGALRVVVGVVFVLGVPGYAVTALLFPAREPELLSRVDRFSPGYLAPLERLVCSVGLSLMTVPLLVLFLDYTQWGITPQSVLLSLCWFTVAATALAAIRRVRTAPTERFRLSVGNAVRRAAGTGRVNLVIAVLLVSSAGLAGTALATTPDSGFTELYLLGEDEETGNLTAGDYPSAIAPDETAPIYVGVDNHERRTIDYTVVVEFQRVQTVDGERSVVSRMELRRLSTTLEPGQSDRAGIRVSPPSSAAGERLRLTFLLYTEDVPENPRIDDAYRSVHTWVNVTQTGGL